MLIDTHCHLHDLEWFTPDQQAEFLQDAHESGVEKIVCVGANPEDSLNAHDFAMKHPDVYWTYGIHPEFATQYDDNFSFFSELFATNEERAKRVSPVTNLVGVRVKKILVSSSEATPENLSEAKMGRDEAGSEKRKSCLAIGEIVLDYHYDQYDRSAQIKLFEQMLQLAIDHDLPVSLHIREAFPDAFAVLDNFPEIRGVVHSFTGSKKDLKKALDRGFYIGVNGLVTYTTPPLPPLERILLETDAPFLTPVPFRGTINKPGYVKQIAAYLATKLGVTELEIAEQTTNNARQIFKNLQ